MSSLKTTISRNRLSLMTFDMERDLVLGVLKIPDIFEIAVQCGLSWLDPMNLSGRAVAEHIACMEKYPVKVHCYISHCSMLQTDDGIKARIEESLKTAETLGARLLMLPPVDSIADRGKAAKLGRDGVREKMAHGFELAVQMAEGTGIKPCLETTPQDFSCCAGTEDCKWLLEHVPGLGFVLDTANMLVHGDDPMESYLQLKSYIVYIHLKDVLITKKQPLDRLLGGEYLPDGRHMKGVLPGDGIIPMDDLLTQMEKDGYSGMFALEYWRPSKLLAGRKDHAACVEKAAAFLSGV